MSITPQDALPEGKYAWGKNIRGYQDGTIEPRYGLDQLTEDPFPDPPHSIFRLNDETPFGEIGAPSRRIVGAGPSVYAGTPGTEIYGIFDPGTYSGNPLTAVAAQPINSPRPFLYIADSLRMRKVNSSLNDMPIGIAQPLLPPTAALAAPQISFLESIDSGAWVEYGPVTTGFTNVDRVNTTVTQLLYDTGVTGMASVSLADFENVTGGMTIDIGASPETVIVHSVHPPVASTTVAAILYDSGTTGLCSIQPTGSFSVGQIEAPLPVEIEHRYRDLNEPLPPRVTVTRTIDFPVDSLILLGGSEVVRIQSVAIGPDGVLSFRCFTFGTFAAGATIAGLASFRAYFNTTKSIGDPAVAVSAEVTVTPAAADTPEVGGIQAAMTGGTNWAVIAPQASSPEDIVRFGIRVSDLAYVESIRLVLDLSPVGPEFLRDYLFYEWRASDLVEAIQAASELTTGLIADAQQTAVERGETTAKYSDQYGQTWLGRPLNRLLRRIHEAGGEAPVDDGRWPFDAFNRLRRRIDEQANQEAIDGLVSTGSGLQRQLALGNDAWMTLECRLGDMTRVGTDTTLTLGNILNGAVYGQFLGLASAITFSVSDPYLTGGFGPDVGTILPPYVYRYSYRSSSTGERSNPSPPMRAGVTPRRGRVVLTVTPSQDPQTDLIDVWRFGGALARWVYVTTEPNETVSPSAIDINDDMADRQIDGGQRIDANQYQPWPLSDLPRTGTCNVAGTSIQWVSGDLFDIEWAPDSLININGRATQLYGAPSSTTRLEVVDNCGSGTAVPFSLPSPTILSQPLPYLFGGVLNDVWFHFSVGDPNDPGVLHWTHGNDPDATSDRNTLTISSGSEPLQNGYFDDGIPYVFSTERQYRIDSAFGGLVPFRASETACTRGLWAPWFFTVDPDGGCFFGNKDGIYHTQGGSDAVSITDPDLAYLFPRDGTLSEPVRNLYPIDFAEITRLRLSIVGRYLYFDYVDTQGEGHTLVYDRQYKSWTADAYLETGSPLVPIGATIRISEPGPQVLDHILAAEDGHLYQYTIDKITDVLDTVYWQLWTPWTHAEDPRAWKQWGDAILDMNPGGSFNGVEVIPCITNGNVLLTRQLLGVGLALRDTFLIEVEEGEGIYSRNFGLQIQGALDACDTQRPILYLWEAASLWKQVSVARRATDWEDLGYKGAKFVQGVVLRANTFGEDKCVMVEYDGPNATPQQALMLTINHDGEQTKTYPLHADGWAPFLAELVRLHGFDDEEWTLLDWRFVWEPAPELATEYHTQDTTFDLPGFMTVRDGVMAYAATAPIVLSVWHDLGVLDYALADTGGVYQRVYVPFAAAKGKAVRFRWRSDEPFRLFKRDVSVRVQGWGVPGGYAILTPFGGPHRIDGAEV